MKNTVTKHTHLVFQTSNAALRQCDETEMFLLTFFDSQISFRFCELVAFKSRIQKIDVVRLLKSNTPDIELLYLHHCDRLVACSVLDILELKELLVGAFVMLELNSIIHKEIVRRNI